MMQDNEFMNMLSDRARGVIFSAIEEARRIEDNFIGTEHILLGLTHDREGIAYKALSWFGLTYEVIRNEITKRRKETQNPTSDRFDTTTSKFSRQIFEYTLSAKEVFKNSMEIAEALQHNYIAPEHILLALCNVDCEAGSIINALGVSTDSLTEKVYELMNIPKEKRLIGKEQVAQQVLEKYGKDLTKLAREGKLDPVIGR